MTIPRSFRTSPGEVSILVCESGRRWCDAARRFVGPFQHAPKFAASAKQAAIDGPVFVVQPAEPSKIRAMIAGHKDVAILWELSNENAASIALTIAQIGVGRPDVLQMVAIGDVPNCQSKDLSLRIMELGVSTIVQSPAELATTARLIRRRFHPAKLDL